MLVLPLRKFNLMKKLFFAPLFGIGILCWTTLTQAATTVKPALQITEPKSGKSTTNAEFTVTGKVTHTLGISNVLYSLNNAPYVPATTTNGWTNWSVVVTLSVGTNSISAYAIDSNGVSSTVEKVNKFTYVVFAPLTVETNGGITVISPKYNGAELEIGKSYKITAKNTDGFTLVNWSGGTSFPLTILTTKTTLDFTMQSNLVLQANMADTEKPYLKITNVTAKLVATNELFTVMGRATDNVAVASINYSIDGSTNNQIVPDGVSWSAPVTLSLGSNIFTVYAVDVNGNVSATNKINILRQPAITTFGIVSNTVSFPHAQLAFDGTNYLVVYQAYSSSITNSQAMGQFVSPAGKIIGVRMSLNPNGQNSLPYLDFDGSNYLVAWVDDSPGVSGTLRGVFVNPAGTAGSVITLSQSGSVTDLGSIVFGGGAYLLTWTDDQTTPNSIFGAFINTTGFNESGDFLISSNGFVSEASGISAAYDQTNFLAVWYSATGKMCIKGCLINRSTGLVGSPFVIYTNSLAAGLSTTSVTFDGTKYLVLFSTSAGSSTAGTYHVLGRFVETDGTVLTNQVTLTKQTGPQIGPSADFDGENYLVTWNQGFNPTTVDKSTTAYGEFLDTEGKPASSIFTLFSTQSGARIPLWAPVRWDGQRFVLVSGLGHMTTNALEFTNSVIYGAFVSP